MKSKRFKKEDTINIESTGKNKRHLVDSGKNMIQIVAKDNTENILIVTTWDCDMNIEYAMFQ